MTQVTYSAAQSRPTQGALLMAVAVLVFACMDATNKHLGMAYSAVLVVAVRYIGNLLWMLAVFAPKQGRALWRVQRRWLVLLRGSCLAAASIFGVLAFQRLPVAEAIAVIFLAPFCVMLLAGPLLHEKIGPVHWMAALAGFVGVLLIVRPGSGLDPVGVLFAMLTAGVSVGYNMLSRSLARSETTLALMFWTAFVGAFAFGAALPFFWPKSLPGGLDLGLFLVLGGLSTVGHLLFTQACRIAPASVIAPVNYLQLFWAGILGWLVFDHVPDPIALAGMGLIALGGVSATIWPMIAPRPLVRPEVPA
jgi:drug/metabolite transporter (DMT)-like permease